MNRRHFLALAGAGLASNALPLVAATRISPKNVPPSKSVELCIATICCDGMGDEDFKHAFETIPQLGLKNVEFNVWFPRNLTPAGIAGIRERCALRGLQPVCLQGLNFGGGTKDAVVKDIHDKLWMMEAARTLGCRRLKCSAYKRDTEGGLKGVIEVVKQLAPAAEERGMLLMLENHAGANLERIEDFQEVFAQVDSPNVGMCLDPAHFLAANVRPEDVLAKLGSKVMHFDLKDLVKAGEKDWARYGEGVLDLPALVKTLLAGGYSGYLCLELSLRDRATMRADLRKGIEMFRPLEQTGEAGRKIEAGK